MIYLGMEKEILLNKMPSIGNPVPTQNVKTFRNI